MIKLIPDDNDIARYAVPSKINKKTGRLNGVAFLLRERTRGVPVGLLP